MKAPLRVTLFVFVLLSFVLAACGGAAATPMSPVQGFAVTEAPAAEALPYIVEPAAPQSDMNSQAGQAPALEQKADGGAADTSGNTSTMPDQNVTIQTGTDALTSAQTSERMVIKNAEVRLLVKETDDAINGMLQIVGDVNAYIISSRAWYQAGPDGKNYKFATVTIGVPVTEFETAMRRLRSLSLRVLDENASGQDVSDEYVDLQSQLGNLEATRDRIRSFLDEAKTVEESLRINQELTNIEAQIEQVKGRMNYLSNRSAFSTITVTFEPDIPALTPTPSPTPVPTATPQPWNPGETMGNATTAVTHIYQGFVEIAIWIVIVVLPLLAPPALLFWLIYKLATRKSKKPASGG